MLKHIRWYAIFCLVVFSVRALVLIALNPEAPFTVEGLVLEILENTLISFAFGLIPANSICLLLFFATPKKRARVFVVVMWGFALSMFLGALLGRVLIGLETGMHNELLTLFDVLVVLVRMTIDKLSTIHFGS